MLLLRKLRDRLKNIDFCNTTKNEIIIKINDINNQMRGFVKPHYDITNDKLNTLFSNITNALAYWTGNTYVGQPKEKALEKVYQTFFELLLELLIFIKDSPRFTNEHKEKIDSVLYQGNIYRYLGYSSEEYHYLDNKEQFVKPNYNGIYVSWSKNKSNSYIESKLRGPITKLKCCINEDMFGIDLEAFGVSRGNEKEVVFPTLEKCITEIQYI